MKREKVLMNQKQLQRYRVRGLVEERRITLREAGEKIGVSHRQTRRIWQRVREKGVKGLIHGNTGRVAWNRISEVVREFVIQLSRDGYREFNDTHFTEKLREEKEVEISREAVRQLRRGGGHFSETETAASPASETAGAEGAGGLDGSWGWESPSLVWTGLSAWLFTGGHG